MGCLFSLFVDLLIGAAVLVVLGVADSDPKTWEPWLFVVALAVGFGIQFVIGRVLFAAQHKPPPTE